MSTVTPLDEGRPDGDALEQVGRVAPTDTTVLITGEQYARLGASQTRRVDVRLICATNRDLEAVY
jgi:transcriptional regulator with GAF, ATPase, and Fis domain